VGGFFGARAAAYTTLKHSMRRAHNLRLIEKPINQLNEELSGCSGAVKIGMDWLEASVKVDPLPTLPLAKEENEKDLLISHLQHGYAGIYEKLQNFRKSYNDFAQRTLEVGKQIENYISSPRIVQEYSVRRPSQKEYFQYQSAVSTFAALSIQQWEWHREEWQEPRVTLSSIDNVEYHEINWTNSLGRSRDKETAGMMAGRLWSLVGS